MRKTIILVAIVAAVAFMALAVYALAAGGQHGGCDMMAAASSTTKADCSKADACCPKEKASCPVDKDSCPMDKDSCPMDAKSCPMKSGTTAKKATAATVTCPVMGGKVVNTKTAKKSVYKGKTYYFCCPSCKTKFDKDPAKYLKTAPKAQDVRCPVMGGKVTDTKAALKSTYNGKTYYFCCAGCKPKFDANPGKYVRS